MTREIAAALPSFIGDEPAPPDSADRVMTVLATMRGLALSVSYEPVGPARRKDPWPSVRPQLERLLLD